MTMHTFSLIALLPLLLLLAGCDDDDEHPKGPPVIQDIQTDITHWHTNFVSSQEEFQARLTFRVSALLDDPSGLSDLASVYFHHVASPRRWYLVGGSGEVPWFANYKLARGVFEYHSFDPDHPDSLLMNGWELVVVDREGHEVSQNFDFSLADGSAVADGVRVHSSAIAPPGGADVAALEAMGQVANDMSLVSDDASSSFDIVFTTNDLRAVDYQVDFYSALPERRFIGYADSDVSPSIASLALSPGVETRLALPWGEILFVGGYTAADVASMQVTLFNEAQPLDYLPGLNWRSWIGVSELVSLP
jgi:hypothetical protein